MRTIYWFICFGFYTFISIMYFPWLYYLIKKGRIEEKRAIVKKISSKWAGRLFRATGSHIDIIGIENIPSDEPVLFVSNHQGNFDIPILIAYIPIPIGFVAKIELKKIPIVRKWMEFGECVFIDRKDIRQSLRAINKSAEILKSGQSMVIFPEGTRSKSNEMQSFKPGSLKLAQKASVRIVPITIKNSYAIFEKNNNKIKPSTVKVVFSHPIDPAEVSKDNSTDLVVKAYDIIKNNL